MSKHKQQVLPALTFGGGRSGVLKVSVGRRGRVVIKGDYTSSLPEAWALVSQLTWFLNQVAAASAPIGSIGPYLEAQATSAALGQRVSGSANTSTTLDPSCSAQLSLLPLGDAPSAEVPANGSAQTATTV